MQNRTHTVLAAPGARQDEAFVDAVYQVGVHACVRVCVCVCVCDARARACCWVPLGTAGAGALPWAAFPIRCRRLAARRPLPPAALPVLQASHPRRELPGQAGGPAGAARWAFLPALYPIFSPLSLLASCRPPPCPPAARLPACLLPLCAALRWLAPSGRVPPPAIPLSALCGCQGVDSCAPRAAAGIELPVVAVQRLVRRRRGSRGGGGRGEGEEEEEEAADGEGALGGGSGEEEEGLVDVGPRADTLRLMVSNGYLAHRMHRLRIVHSVACQLAGLLPGAGAAAQADQQQQQQQQQQQEGEGWQAADAEGGAAPQEERVFVMTAAPGAGPFDVRQVDLRQDRRLARWGSGAEVWLAALSAASLVGGRRRPACCLLLLSAPGLPSPIAASPSILASMGAPRCPIPPCRRVVDGAAVWDAMTVQQFLQAIGSTSEQAEEIRWAQGCASCTAWHVVHSAARRPGMPPGRQRAGLPNRQAPPCSAKPD